MTQPRIIGEEPITARVQRKHAGRTRKTPVRVSIRSLIASPSKSGRAGTGAKATTRWWVRGHWRQQAWGKGRKLRKPVFIQPHTAGTADAEVDATPRVQVWRTGGKEK